MTSSHGATIAAALEGRVRTYLCGGCGERHDTLRLTGRLPERCLTCAPSSPPSIRERSDREQRAAIVALHGRVRELEAEIDATVTPGGPRARRYGPPGRTAFGRAVRRVTVAAGSAGTREALLDAAAAAQAWAWVLGGRYDR